jgi:hypothetical protein
MVKRRAFLAILGIFSIVAMALATIRQPSFLFNAWMSDIQFDGVSVQTTTSPSVILFADVFEIQVKATFDSREFNADSLKFIIPTRGLVIREEKEERQLDGFIMTIKKTVSVQCLSCLPREEQYALGQYGVMIRMKNGELKSFSAFSPQIRVVSRLSSQDLKNFPYSLGPRKPIVSPMQPGRGLIPYFLFFGMLCGGLGIVTLVALLRRRSSRNEAALVPVVKTRFQDEIRAVSSLFDRLSSGKISPDRAAAECYRTLRAILSRSDIIGDEKAALEHLRENLLEQTFGPPERVNQKLVEGLISEVRAILRRAAKQEARA